MSRRGKEEKIFINNYIPLAPSHFYTKSRLQDVLSRPIECFNNSEIKNFDLIYYDLHQKKLDHPLEYYQTIIKDRFKDFDWQTTAYLHVELKETICFMTKVLIVNFLKKKNSAYFLVCDEENVLP